MLCRGSRSAARIFARRLLVLSPATVRTHFQYMYRKLGVTDRAAAVAEAMRMGVVN